MQKAITILILLFSVIAAKAQEEEPYLVKTKDFTVNNFSLSQIDLGITAVIYNPYKAKIKIDEILIDVFIENKKLGTITEAADIVKINKQSAFDLPLKIAVKTGPTLSKFATEGAKLLIGYKVRVDYKGYVKVKALGFIPIKVKIDQFAYFTMKDIIGTSEPTPKKIEPKDPTITKP
ncbi:MAG: LEA type 2 family protein [Saprospirales bacterium]|nr:LEA type 2 family protein [Saprospirales bacterium]